MRHSWNGLAVTLTVIRSLMLTVFDLMPALHHLRAAILLDAVRRRPIELPVFRVMPIVQAS